MGSFIESVKKKGVRVMQNAANCSDLAIRCWKAVKSDIMTTGWLFPVALCNASFLQGLELADLKCGYLLTCITQSTDYGQKG